MSTTTTDTLAKILNIIGLLIAFSGAFYFAGLLYEAGYASTLGIPRQLFQGDYNSTLIKGILEFLPLLPLILYCIGSIYLILWFRREHQSISKRLEDVLSLKTKILALNTKFQSVNDESLQAHSKESYGEVELLENKIRETLTRVSNVEKGFLSFWNSKGELIIFCAFVLFSVLTNCILAVVISHSFIWEQIVQSILTTGGENVLGYFIYRNLKPMMDGDPRSFFRAILIFPMIVLALLVLPAGDGVTQAKIDLKTNNFKKVTLINSTESRKAYFVSATDNHMTFLFNGQIEIIPRTEIKALNMGW